MFIIKFVDEQQWGTISTKTLKILPKHFCNFKNIRPLSHWTFISRFYLEISFEIILAKTSKIHLEINFQKPYVNNIVNASVNVCKHWPIDQSQRSTNFFHKISQNRTCSKLCNRISKFISLESLVTFTRKFLVWKNLHKFRNKFPMWKGPKWL